MELNVKSKLITAIFALLLTLILFTNANNPTQKQQKPTYNYEEIPTAARCLVPYSLGIKILSDSGK